ncbi:formin-like protein 13 [Tripterygium wilfordii]|uniref:formin-like protein 13 n=1 Tax=Tripterygium wilfordii TaxID=458696 RepID=UPI0018F8121E|nr:formin-like protein 13 [Tripterygium wilfordii]
MALFRKLFYKKPPDGLLEICERVYAFDCCFTTDGWEEENYKDYIGGIVGQLKEHLPDASFLVFNFREGETRSELADILSEYDMTIMDYPRHYEGCPLLTMEMLHHFLRSCESWLSLGQHNVLIMHCERGGWPILAFMLAALLIYRRLYSGEHKTLDMIYRQAPRELLQLLSPLNPIPSQLRYLKYVSRRNVASEWPPLDRALTLDCIILRFIPNFDGEGGCRPLFRIYGQDPFLVSDKTTKVLYSTPKRSKAVRTYKQAECELAKFDINCHIQGDVVLECISLNDDMEREEMMFRVMFNTAFIRSNILILNRDEIDMLWDTKDQFSKVFRTEILFSEMDAAAAVLAFDFSHFEDEGLPVEAFAKVHEIFNYVDWLDPKADAALNVLQHIGAANIVQEISEADSRQSFEMGLLLSPRRRGDNKKHGRRSSLSSLQMIQAVSSLKSSSDADARKEADSMASTEISNQITASQAVFDPVVESKIASIAPSTPPLVQPPKTSSTKLLTPPPPPPPPTPPSHSLTLDPTPAAKETESSSEDRASSVASSNPPTTIQPSPAHPPPPPPPLNENQSIRVGPPPSPPPPPPLNDNPSIKAGPPPPLPPPMPPLNKNTSIRAGPPPPPPRLSENTSIKAGPPPPSPPSPPPLNKNPSIRAGPVPSPSPPPLNENPSMRAGPPPPPPITPCFKHNPTASVMPPSMLPLSGDLAIRAGPPPPPPPPFSSGKPSAPPPPPLESRPSSNSSRVPSVPPPPVPTKGISSKDVRSPSPAPPSMPPSAPLLSSSASAKGRLSRTLNSRTSQAKKLKPLHWLKLSRAAQGSLWAEEQKSGEASKAPEIDMSELESLFSAAVPNSDCGGKSSLRTSHAPKSDRVQLIDHRRAYNCEIMLSKVKVPLHELMSSVLVLEDSALDVDQVDNLIKFCPTKEEMELLKGYTGDKEKLGKCEQFFLELMKVPRVESKLRVFSFKMQFHSQVRDLRNSLNIVNSAAEEIKNSAKLKRVMQTILSLGNALNQGTARGSAIGFRLDSLLKLTETRARDNKMTLMHYLCKVIADKLPELLDFSKDLTSLEPSSKIQLKFLAEEMQAISKGLEKVVQELSTSENDGPISENFSKALKEFLHFAEAEVRTLASLYSVVGRNVDALIVYFGEDPARCTFEQAISTLLNFVRMFVKAHEDNCKQLELEMKKSAESDRMKTGASHKESERLLHTQIQSSNVK